MQPRDQQIVELIDILQFLARDLDRLRDRLAANRGAFVAISSRGLAPALEDLAPAAQSIAELEEKRAQLCAQLGETMQIDGQIRVSSLAAHLPSHLGGRLRIAADRADAAARRVRAETNAGTRLLAASRQTNEQIVRAITGAPDRQGSGYDNRAHRVGNHTDSGNLLSGTA